MSREKWQIWIPSKRIKKKIETEKLTPVDLREALTECFIHAQGSEIVGMAMLKKQFKNAGVSWENPTKDGIIEVMNLLREMATIFRDEEIIKRNYEKMMSLVEMCEE